MASHKIHSRNKNGEPSHKIHSRNKNGEPSPRVQRRSLALDKKPGKGEVHAAGSPRAINLFKVGRRGVGAAAFSMELKRGALTHPGARHKRLRCVSAERTGENAN